MNHLAFLGTWELIAILAVVMLIFGSRKLPELARSMGKSVTEFKTGLKDDPDLLDKSDKDDEDEKDTK